MSKYDVNIGKLAVQLLPMCLRGGILKAMVRAFATPLQYVSDAFEALREVEDYRITHNGQVCYLRAALNDKFDPMLRGIDIVDGDGDYDGIIIHTRSEDEPLSIHKRITNNPVTVFKRNFGGSRSVSFKVRLPRRFDTSDRPDIEPRIDLYELNATINKYKVAGMRYEVIYV